MQTLLTYLLAVITCQSLAQTVISGKVADVHGQPVPLANVYLFNTYDGTTADINGAFGFKSDEKGQQVLVVKFLGYREHRQPVVLGNGPITLEIQLTEEISELKAVTISAGSFAASDESRRTVFRAVDIATTAGATADIAGALNTLPGTQKVGESGRLFVRGGDGDEVKTFIDGMMVFDAYSPAAPNTPSRGRFLPFMFKGTSFSTGGYTAEYGQALSSALVLDTRDESSIDRTDIGVLSVGGDVAHTRAWNKGSIAGKVQYTNLRPYVNLISQEIDWVDAPLSYEGVMAFRQHIGQAGMIKAYGNVTQSEFSLDRADLDNPAITHRYELKNRYNYWNGFFKGSVGEQWSVRGGMSYSSIDNQVKYDDLLTHETDRGLHSKLVLSGNFSEMNEVRTGVELIRQNFTKNMVAADEMGQSFSNTMLAWFTEADLYASNNFVARVGQRMEFNSLNNQLTVDPRVSLAYKTGEEGQLSFAFGNFHQTARNQYVLESNGLKTEKATHYILNYQVVHNDKTFRLEGYYKQYNDLVKFGEDGLTNYGSGYAKGIEAFWRDNRSVRNLDYWLSYSFLDTERDYLHFPEVATPTFASRHNFSVVGKYFVSKLKSQLGATFSYASGRPYHDPNSAGFNTGKTPSYQDLSFNWSYLLKPYIIVHASCTNLLGRDNIFGYEFGQVRNEQGLYNQRAIRQPAPRFLFLGVFITLSKDKSSNQLPTL